MYKTQITERNSFKYPPFYRLIKITLKHKETDTLNEASAYLAKTLRKTFGNRVLGPEFPLVSRIKNFYLKDILIKIEKNLSIASNKALIMDKLQYFSLTYKSVRVIIDVDPQ
jgi:primosomal protein N' (replication factor Y)